MIKKLLLSLLILVVISFNGISQNFKEIGDGTVSTSLPFYSSWKYSWSSLIYTSEEIGAAKSITDIGLNVVSGTKTLTNQKIYIKHIGVNEFASADYEDPENNGYTLVYDGEISFVIGWNKITFISPFEYNGTDNIAIHVENSWGQTYGPAFNSTISTINNNKSSGSDTEFPTGTGYLNAYPNSLTNIRFYYTSDAPATPVTPLPETNRIKVNLDTALTFTLGANTTNYDLYFGTDQSSLTKIVDNATAVVGVNSNVLATQLESSTKYFWKVVAKNATKAEDGPVWSFTTQGAITDFPWQEGFQDVWFGVSGDLYYSSVINVQYDDSTDWSWNDSWNITSEPNAQEDTIAAYCNPWKDGDFWLKTPRIILPADQRVSFWWKNGGLIYDTKTAGNDTTFFQITTDGGTTWNDLDTLSPETAMTDWVNSIHDLSAYAGDNVYLRWYSKVNNQQATIKIFLDNIRIYPKPSGAQIEISETSYQYPDVCYNGEVNFDLIIRNTGITDMVVSDISSDGPFECDFTGTIEPGGADTVKVYFKPLEKGDYNNSLTIASNAEGENKIVLSGTALDLVTEFYETFDAAKEIPANWGHIDSPDGYISGGGVSVISSTYDSYSQPYAAKIMIANDTVSPAILIAPGAMNYNTHRVTFFAKKAGAEYQLDLIVGTMTNPYDASTFVPAKTINLDSEFRSDTVTFKPTNKAPYIAFMHGGSAGADKYTSIRIDNIAWEEDVETSPLPANLVYPASDETEVGIMKNLNLKWTAGSSNTINYKVYVGTSNDNFDIVDGETIGNNPTSYEISADLNYNTQYFWKIVATNTIGESEENEVRSFTTMQDPTISEFPWNENFDSTPNNSGMYDCPLGWSMDDANSDKNTWDILADNPGFSAFSHSAPNSMHVAFGFQPKDDYLYTPPLDLKVGDTYKLTFWLHTDVDMVTGNIYKEKIKVFLGTDNEVSFMNEEIVSDSIKAVDYKKVETEFTVSEDDIYYLGFYAWSDAFMYLLIIDDVKLEKLNSAPEFTSTPIETGREGIDYSYSITASDDEDDDITITCATKPEWLVFADNGDGTASLNGTPNTSGNYNIVLKASDGIDTTAQEYTIVVAENSAPEFTSQAIITATADEVYTYNISVSDDDGDDISITTNTKPDWLVLTANGEGTGVLTGTPTAAGDYNVELLASDAIEDVKQEFSITVSATNGIGDLNSQHIFKLMPNPAHGFTILKITDEEMFPCQVQVFNIIGETVYTELIDTQEHKIELDGVDGGLYFVKISNGAEEYVQKLIIR